jgi:ABC-2 type transport system permease protein
MISTIVKISLLNLKRDRVAVGLTFFLPIIFFSIFATIFGATDRGTREDTLKVVVADLDATDLSGRLVASLQKQDALAVSIASDRESARKQVHDGKFPVAIVIQPGFATTFRDFASQTKTVELIYDNANPIAQNTVGGLLQAAAMLLMAPTQQAATMSLLRIQPTDVREGEAPTQAYSMIAYYAAGTGVMFLLFSMSGAGGALLEEQESGTLERVLGTNVSMAKLLAGKWLFLSATGAMQLTIMFVWAALVFHMKFFTAPRLAGFAAMALVTALTAAAFGLVLATACKTRQQLSGTSTIIILIMSALGGSMVPRFVMPAFMNTTALFTINGWALDGFLKVFWYDDPNQNALQTLSGLLPQLAMLSAFTAVFLATARVLARRWETM